MKLREDTQAGGDPQLVCQTASKTRKQHVLRPNHPTPYCCGG